MPRIPVEIKIEADALEEMTRRHVDRLMDELGYRCDMRAVIIVEFWAMMAGALPYGWSAHPSDVVSGYVYAEHSDGSSVASRNPLHRWADEMAAWADAWAAEYAARPRLER